MAFGETTMTALLDRTCAAPPGMVAAAVDATAQDRTAPLPIAADYLDGGEIVLLAVKPSPWFVLFDSVRWLCVAAVLLVISLLPEVRFAGLSSYTVAQLAAAIGVGRLGIAILRWAARYYVLTNRRVMRLRGVFRPDVLACPLVRIRNTRVQRSPHERLCKLGTIQFLFEQAPEGDLDWREIARVDNVHEQVRRAIERALDNQPHL
jgi:membrane protein YdbS with pleckstrin-like domain